MNRAPYKYFDYYTSADADLFFGREKETQMMVGEILSSRLLVLFARSGSGKTSLINAGVVPELQRRGYETLYVRFESDPLTSLQNAAREQLQHAGAANDLHGLLQNVTAARKKPLVVFLDQFEEFFLVFADQPALRQDFITQIASVKYDEQLPVFLVLSLREDYYASLHEFRNAIPSIFQNNANIRLGAFTDDEAKRAILLPLAAVGLQMETGLAEKIIHDLKPSRNGQERREDNASGIEPITLQIVCHKLWQMKPRDAATMTASVYEKCGGAQKILRNHVSEFLQKISRRQQGLVVRIFEALKTRDNTKLYRRLQDLQETLRLRDSRRLKNALQKLAEIGVLRHEQRSGDDWYEFKHDDLVPEVTAWIQARRERINRNRLIYAISPAILFVLILSGYIFYQFNTFYASFAIREYPKQQEEIIISRGKPFGDIITTGFLMQDVRGYQSEDKLKGGFKIGFWKRNDWSQLVENLNLAQSGIFLYRIGQFNAGVDKLVAGLKYRYSNIPFVETIEEQATGALIKLGHSDKRVVPVLVAALKNEDSDVRERAVNVLVKLGHKDEGVITALITTLRDKDSDVSEQAAEALVKLGHSDERVITVLVDALKDEDSGVRAQAAGALIKLGHNDEGIVRTLVATLKDENDEVRWEAAEALGNLCKSDEWVIEALVAVVENDEEVRMEAAAALGKIGKSDERVIRALVAAIGYDLDFGWVNLVNLGKSDERVIDALITTLKDKNLSIRMQIAIALGELGKGHERAIGALVVSLKDDKNWRVRELAAFALGELGKNDTRVIGALIAALKDKDSSVRSAAANALGDIGENDTRVIEALIVTFNDKAIFVHESALEALGNLGKRDERVIGTLFTALKDEDSDIRIKAAEVLVKLGYSDKGIIETLVDVLEFGESEVRIRVATALEKINYSDERLIEALVALLKDESSHIRSLAAEALGRLLQTRSHERLITFLAHHLSGYRTAAAQALVRQDSITKEVQNEIDRLRNDKRPWVRLGAWDAYELIQERINSEKEAASLIRNADSLFVSGRLAVASNLYELAFEILKDIIRVDSIKTSYAKFQQARCAAKLKRVVPALDGLKMAFEYNPTWRGTLQAEMAHPNNDWAILQGNWYLREVLLKKR